MAVYSVVGRMKVYEVVGRPFGNDVVPPHREGSGSIEGAGVVSIENLLAGTGNVHAAAGVVISPLPGFIQSGGVTATGDTASEASSVRIGAPFAVGAGSIAIDSFAIGGKSIVVQGDGSPDCLATPAHTSVLLAADGNGSLAASGRTTQSLIEALTNAGLTSGLTIALDAALITSYPGSGQTWADVSGQGNSVTRGANSSAASDDPTFNGSAGALTSNEYWSFDGGDFFRLSTANPTAINNLHKDNALWTAVAVVWISSLADFQGVFGTDGNSANNRGLSWRINTTNGQQIVRVRNGTGANALSIGSSAPTHVPTGQWVFIGVSVDEASDTSIFFMNGASTTTSGSYTSPSSSDATYTFEIGAFGNTVQKILSGGRIPIFALLTGVAFSSANFSSLFANLRGRFGI